MVIRKKMFRRWGLLTALLAFGFCAMAQEKNKFLVEPIMTPELISLQPAQEVDSYTLTVRGPEGVFFETQFSGLSAPFIELFDPAGGLLPDGQYAFELKATPLIDPDFKAEMLRARANGDYEAAKAMWAEAKPDFDMTQSGYFRIHQGQIVTPAIEEPVILDALKAEGEETGGDNTGGSPVIDQDVPFEAQTFATDLVVQGSACIGFDCTSGESFGFDTIRLKENNLRIRFMDTSNSGSFPTRDWQLTANDTSNGGADRFSIDDIDGGRTPFTIEASAPSHSLYVDDGGRVGFGTSTPSVELHVVDGDSPTLRLQQDGSSGFAAQTWDVAGNETNFFVRDVTNGSELPFKIRPGADDNAIYINTDNNVGLLTASPSAALHVRRTDGTAQVFVEEASSTTDGRFLVDLKNNGPTRIRYQNTDSGFNWNLSNDAAGFIIDGNSNSGEDLLLTNSGRLLVRPNGVANPGLVLENNGNMTIAGMLSENSNRNAKKNFEPVNSQEVLSKVASLPLSKWTYKDDELDARHLGPMAQDFADAFGLGHTRESIATLDVGGVALAAIQGLNERLDAKERQLEEKDEAIDTLAAQNQELQTRLQALEKLVEKLANKSE